MGFVLKIPAFASLVLWPTIFVLLSFSFADKPFIVLLYFGAYDICVCPFFTRFTYLYFF
jgi:hypothetical protein